MHLTKIRRHSRRALQPMMLLKFNVKIGTGCGVGLLAVACRMRLIESAGGLVATDFYRTVSVAKNKEGNVCFSAVKCLILQ